jgi:hypothetical protein
MYPDARAGDELEEGAVEFGLEVDNPIPTKSKLYNLQNLNSLVTADGSEITYQGIGSFQSKLFPGTSIDGYAIKRSDGKGSPWGGFIFVCTTSEIKRRSHAHLGFGRVKREVAS